MHQPHLPRRVPRIGARQGSCRLIHATSSCLSAALDRRLGYEVINLGESNTVTLATLIELIERAVGRPAIIKRQPAQPGDVPVTFADVGKAKRLLDYNPQVPIEAGIPKFVEWFRAQS